MPTTPCGAFALPSWVVDVATIEAFRRREEGAVRAMYREYGNLVYAVAHRVLGRNELAEEAAQQTFVQAWQAADRIDVDREPASWLATIAKRAEDHIAGGQVLDVTRTIAEVFERALSGSTSYLSRFGVKDARVVLSQDGTQTSWQVPDFSIDTPTLCALFKGCV
jgi:hypothetical protein